MQCFVYSYLLPLDSKPRIQRRHSLHSPTGEPRQLTKQIASMDSTHSYRPHSMIIDYPASFSSKEESTSDPAPRTLQQPNGNISRVRSLSNQNLASLGVSFAAQPHTCSGSMAPTTSQLQVTPAAISAGLSLSTLFGRPKLIKQFSQASPCAADSPSPVERDGVLPSSSSYRNKSNSVQKMGSVEVQYSTDMDADRVTQISTTDHSKAAPKQIASSRRCLKDKQYLDASLHSSVPSRSKVAPNHSHSSPEFPLTASMGQTERTHSYDDLYSKRRQPQFQPQAEENEVSPSREKINNLSSQIYSSLDQNWATTLSSYATNSYHHLLKDGCVSSEPNHWCEVMQKIIQVTTPLLHLNQAHMRTLISSACSNTQQEARSSYTSLDFSSHCSEGDEVHDSPTSHLLNLGYKLVDKPLTVSFGSPYEGHMTLTFELMDLRPQKRDALLKVI